MAAEDLDVFAAEVEVEDASSSGPGWLPVLLALLGVGVLLALVVIIIAALLSADNPESTTSPNDGPICGGATSCTDLTVEQIDQLVALELPEGTEVVTSRYEQTEAAIVVEARVVLPVGAANPFEGTAYFEVDQLDTTFPAGIVPIALYAATGELGALNADAVYGTGTNGETIVAIALRRDL